VGVVIWLVWPAAIAASIAGWLIAQRLQQQQTWFTELSKEEIDRRIAALERIYRNT
jgi:hypothetical protein